MPSRQHANQGSEYLGPSAGTGAAKPCRADAISCQVSECMYRYLYLAAAALIGRSGGTSHCYAKGMGAQPGTQNRSPASALHVLIMEDFILARRGRGRVNHAGDSVCFDCSSEP